MPGPDTALPPTDPDDTERRLIAIAVAEARAEPGPGIPHEVEREAMLRDIDRLRRKVAELTRAP